MNAGEKGLNFIAAIFVVSASTGMWLLLLLTVLDGFNPAYVGVAAVGTIYAIPVVSAAGVIIGMPISAILNACHVTSIKAFLAAGFGAGAAAGPMLGWLVSGQFWPGLMLVSSVPGMTGGAFWWWAVARHADENPWSEGADMLSIDATAPAP